MRQPDQREVKLVLLKNETLGLARTWSPQQCMRTFDDDHESPHGVFQMRNRIVRFVATFTGIAGAYVCAPSASADDDASTSLAQLGISPESLVVSGAHEYVSDILTTACGLQGDFDLLMQSQLQSAMVQSELVSVIAQRRANPGDEALESAQHSLAAELETRQFAIEQQRETLVDAVFEEVPVEVQLAHSVFLNSMQHEVPHEFRSALRTDAEWESIVIALRIESRCTRKNESVPAEHAAILANVRGEYAVINARVCIDSFLGQTVLAFDTYGCGE